jgi:hypothetical protein
VTAARAGQERCTWCAAAVDGADGFRAYEPEGERRAVFCRLEHIVPWAIQGPHWEPGRLDEAATVAESVDVCAHCGDPLTDARVLLVRHRGQQRIPDGFCSVTHLRDWAKGGGRWRAGGRPADGV